MISLYSSTLSRLALTSAARINGTANGATVDLGVFGNDFRTVKFVITTATVTDGTHAVTVQNSDDGSSWANAAADSIQGTLPSIVAADDNAVFEFGYMPGTKQYVRLVVTTSGATTGGVFSATAELGEGSTNPVARA